VGIEVRLNPDDPRPKRGFLQGCDDLQVRHRWLVNNGEQAARLPSGVEILPLPHAMGKLKEMTGT
jgi:hypothetical protein